MNKPPKGNTLRINNAPQLMLQVSALNDSVNPMRVRISEGSFWINNTTFVEVSEQNSPVIEAPISGAKWVLVYADSNGMIKLSNGQATVKTAPPQPVINKNCMPLAFVFVKSGTTQITSDVIFPCHTFLSAGGYPQTHNELQGRSSEQCHTINAIEGLQEALDDRVTKTESVLFFENKADIDGTVNNLFTLNKDFAGNPIENCGIMVNRGNELNAGIRFNEDSDKWQYCNDGMNWHNFDNDTDLYDCANENDLGMVKLSVPAEDVSNPVVVAINDPQYASIVNKADKTQLNNYYNKSEIGALLDAKVGINDVYNKFDAEQTFVTKVEYSNSSIYGYSKDELNSILSLKANAVSTYSKSEVDNYLKNYYTKAEVESVVARIATGQVNVYTTQQIDTIINNVKNNVYSKADMNTVIENVNNNINMKANISDVYTKLEIDTKLASINVGGSSEGNTSSNVNLYNYYTKSEINTLFSSKSDSVHNHMASDVIQDDTHKFVTSVDISNWNNKQNALTFTPEDISNKGAINGYASLDNNGKIPLSQLPSNLGTSGVGSWEIILIDNYNDLLSIENPSNDKMYLVVDASADNDVTNGAAEYIYKDGSWVNICTFSDLHYILDWNNVLNKPTAYVPDTTYLSDYVVKKDIYSKEVLNDKFDAKAESQHTHDSMYVKLSNYNVFKLGNYIVDETGIDDGKVLTYDSVNRKLIYTENENNGTNLGHELVEPASLKANYSLIYDGSVLTYKDMRGYLGTTEVDEADMSANSALVYDGNKLVYKPISDAFNIDNANRNNGYLLAYNAISDKLEYVEPVNEKHVYTYTVETITGRKCIVRANMMDAITYTVNGSNIVITKKEGAEIYMLQMYVQASDHNGTATNPATLTVEIVSESGNVPDYDTYEDLMPSVTYYAMDSTRRMMTSNIAFDIAPEGVSNPLKMKITNIVTYNYVVKMLF